MKKTTLVGLTTLTVFFSNALGHFFTPYGIVAIPVTMSIIAGIINITRNNFSLVQRALLSYLFIAINDILLKFFAGGIHDSEGMGWVTILTIFGLIPSTFILSISANHDKRTKLAMKIVAVILFLCLLLFHIWIFQNVGVKLNA